MYHSTQSDIIRCIEKGAEAVSHGATETNTQQQHDCVVQDGGQLIHQLDARGTGIFEQFTQRLFLKHLQVELRKVSRLDIVWDTCRPMSTKGHTRDEHGHSVRLKVGPNMRILGNWSEFLRDSTNKVELFKYLPGEVMQRFHSGGDIYITMSNGTTVGRVGPGEDMTTVCNQEEADTRIILDIIHALNCRFSSILIKTSDSDVTVILIHHLQHFDTISTGCNITVNYGIGKTQRVINIRELACALRVQRSAALCDPHWMRLNVCHDGALCFSAWKKCSPRVTECMVELLDSPLQPLQMDAKFDALEELFIQIYGRGQVSSINQVRKTIFCQRNQNVEMIPPSQNALFQHYLRAM